MCQRFWQLQFINIKYRYQIADELILFIVNYVLLKGIIIVKCWSITFMLWFTNLRHHDYNMRTKKQEEENNMSVAIANLETKLLDGFSSLEDEEINLKDVIIRNL